MLSFLVSTPDFKKKSHLNFVIDHEERNPSHWDKNSFPLWTRGRECDDSHVGWRQRQQNLSANHAFSLERLPHLSQSSISILLQWCFFFRSLCHQSSCFGVILIVYPVYSSPGTCRRSQLDSLRTYPGKEAQRPDRHLSEARTGKGPAGEFWPVKVGRKIWH